MCLAAALQLLNRAIRRSLTFDIVPPTKLLIFGSPKAGTPVMLAAPSVALDLPLKMLVREDGQGRVWISYNSTGYLQERHGLPKELVQNLAVVDGLAAEAGE